MQSNDIKQPFFDAEHKDFFVSQLRSYAEDADALITEALEAGKTSFTEVKERYQEQDWNQTAEDIYEALNEIDDSPLAKLIHGAAYGVSDQAIKIASVVFDKVAERFGETLTTTINDPQTVERLVGSFAKEIQSDIKNDTLNPNWQDSIETSYDPNESLEPQPDKDYLNMMAKKEVNTSPSQGMER